MAGAVVQVRDPQGAVVAREVTAANGQFEVFLQPGVYKIRTRLRNSPFPRCPEVEATVRLDEEAHVNINCDSGMR